MVISRPVSHKKICLEIDFKLSFEARHVLLSVGIATNVPDFKEKVCVVTNDDQNKLMQKMTDYPQHAPSAITYELMKPKFSHVFSALETIKA